MKDVQEIIKNRYLEMKAEELKRAWQERAAKVRQEREAARAAEAARKAQAAAEQAAKPAPDVKPQEPAAEKPVPSKGAMLKTFGRWAAGKAKEGAHALEDKIHDALEDKPAKPANSDTPAAPARKNTNSTPKNGG